MTLYSFSDWLKEQRAIRDLSQSQLSELTKSEIPQSTISAWELNKTFPSVRNIALIARSLNIPMSSIPWDYIDFGLNEKAGGGIFVKERYSLYELPTADSVRTFEGKTYKLKGFIGVERESGEIKHITDLYYCARTVVANNRVLAKRKNTNDELICVNKNKKIKEPN